MSRFTDLVTAFSAGVVAASTGLIVAMHHFANAGARSFSDTAPVSAVAEKGPVITPARASEIVKEELEERFARRFIGADQTLDPIKWTATDKLVKTDFSSVLVTDGDAPVIYYDAGLHESEFRHAVEKHFDRLLFVGQEGVMWPWRPLGLRRADSDLAGQQCRLCFYTYAGETLSQEETAPRATNFIDWAKKQGDKKPAP